MVTCERCNTENLDGSQYCDECGALLAGTSARSARKPQTNPSEQGGVKAASGNADGAAASPPASAAAPATKTNAHTDAPPPLKAASATAAAVAAGALAASAGSARAGSSAHAKLVIHRGRSAGKEFPMNEEEAQIGRWDADGGIFPDIDLDSDDPEAKVSRRHARITRRGEQYFIEDLGSTNGTFINRGRRLLPGDRQPLYDGDEVIVGKTFLRFEVIKH